MSKALLSMLKGGAKKPQASKPAVTVIVGGHEGMGSPEEEMPEAPNSGNARVNKYLSTGDPDEAEEDEEEYC